MIRSLNKTCNMTYTGHPGVCVSVCRPQLLQWFCGRRQDSRQRPITSADTLVNIAEGDKHRQTHEENTRWLCKRTSDCAVHYAVNDPPSPRTTPVHVSLNNTEQLVSRGRDLPVAHCLDTDPSLFVRVNSSSGSLEANVSINSSHSQLLLAQQRLV